MKTIGTDPVRVCVSHLALAMYVDQDGALAARNTGNGFVISVDNCNQVTGRGGRQRGRAFDPRRRVAGAAAEIGGKTIDGRRVGEQHAGGGAAAHLMDELIELRFISRSADTGDDVIHVQPDDHQRRPHRKCFRQLVAERLFDGRAGDAEVVEDSRLRFVYQALSFSLSLQL